MKAGEGFREAFRRFITVTQRDIDHLVIRLPQFKRSLIKPAVPQVFPDTIAGHQREPALKEKWRKIHPLSHILRTDVFFQVTFHVINCRSNCGDPLHCCCLLSLMKFSIAEGNRFVLSFSVQFCLVKGIFSARSTHGQLFCCVAPRTKKLYSVMRRQVLNSYFKCLKIKSNPGKRI